MPKIKNSSGGLLLFGVIWTLFSSTFAGFGIKSCYDAYNRSSWPLVPCTLSHFEISANSQEDPPFKPVVSYQYTWQGQNHESHRVWADKKGDSDYEELAPLLEQYRDGELTQCRVNPADPAEAVLIASPGEIWGGLAFSAFGIGFMAIGIGMIVSSRKKNKEDDAPLSSRSSGNEAPRAILIPFFSVFAIAGFAVLFTAVIPQWVKYSKAKGWVATPAEVVWSRVQSHSDEDGTTYSVDIFYRYQFNGRDYRSNTSGLLSGSSSGRASKQQEVDAHPAGSEITCYVNPEQPWQALLHRELGWWGLFALFPLPFIGAGVGGLWWLLRKKPTARKGSKAASSGQLRPKNPSTNPFVRSATALSHHPVQADSYHRPGQRSFKPTGKRLGWFFGAIGIALFWNGIVSVFVWHAADSWLEGKPEWFLTLFIIPFVIIGLGLIGHVGYRLLGLFNPAATLTLQPGEITLGESAKLTWRLPGGSSRISRFTIYLVGEEEAKYQRGTSTVTDTEIFYEQALTDTDKPGLSSSGSANILLDPAAANIMPSWKAEHNRIKWSLRVKGTIRFWPDVSDEYAITVRPVDPTD